MAESDVPLPEIAQFPGYAGHGTTERVYAKYSLSHLKGAAAALHKWGEGSNEPKKKG